MAAGGGRRPKYFDGHLKCSETNAKFCSHMNMPKIAVLDLKNTLPDEYDFNMAVLVTSPGTEVVVFDPNANPVIVDRNTTLTVRLLLSGSETPNAEVWLYYRPFRGERLPVNLFTEHVKQRGSCIIKLKILYEGKGDEEHPAGVNQPVVVQQL